MNPADVCSGERSLKRRLTPGEWDWIQQMRRAATCARKKPYHSRDQAVRVGVSRVNSLKDAPASLTPYLCQVCRKWHLTRSKTPPPTNKH